MVFQFPPILTLYKRFKGNVIRQLILPGYAPDVDVERHTGDRIKGCVITPKSNDSEKILCITGKNPPPEGFDKVLRLSSKDLKELSKKSVPRFDATQAKWIKHPSLPISLPKDQIDYKSRIREVLKSWSRAFTYRQEDRKRHKVGLRSPQIGAVHAVHAHWATSDEVATVVMPTGTGKTEAMLSVLISSQCKRLLVVVPTDALRSQIGDKFLTLGILKDAKVVARRALYPIVGTLNHKPKSEREVDDFFTKCNVIVTTMNIAGQCPPKIQKRIAHHCPFVFIDEAHHVAATTWKKFKVNLKSSKVVQFTATPFRNDYKPLEGKIIFEYPLKKAQEEELFERVNLNEVDEFDSDRKKVDQVIAERAIEQLVRDRSKEYDHILMARVESIKRARQVFSIYKKCVSRHYKEYAAAKGKNHNPFKELNPVQIHTGIKSMKEREEIRKKIINKESRIIICVDMLGEGFDLPELKIAAFHDIRKSLPITLQLVGRLVRFRRDLGAATVIANTANTIVNEEIAKLYAHNADWNVLLSRSSRRLTTEQVKLQSFLAGFHKLPQEVPLQYVRSRTSAVFYRTKCKEWRPQYFLNGMRDIDSLETIYYDIDRRNNILIIVAVRKAPPDWLKSEEIFDLNCELCVLLWDKKQNLLSIHSSGNRGCHQELAEAVAGASVTRIRDEDVFRCLAGIERLKLHNVGLTERPGRLISYTMRAGSDVEPGISEAIKRNAKKCNIFGSGYEDGSSTTIGCSVKGRIWAHSPANLRELVDWCRSVGSKLLDKSAKIDDILEGTLVPEAISERPEKMPIYIDWPDKIYREPETAYTFSINKKHVGSSFNTDIKLVDPDEHGDIRFEILSGKKSARFVLSLFEEIEELDERDEKGAKITRVIKYYKISADDKKKATVEHGKTTEPLEEFFYENPPIIWFADGSYLEGNLYTKLKKTYSPYPKKKIEAWVWPGIDIRKESHIVTEEEEKGPKKVTKRKDSIQYRVIQELKKKNYDIIFDDDDSGEAADVVTIKAAKKKILVEFYHCKFCKEGKPGARIKDLYEVCGQAQKSIHWVEKPLELFNHLKYRDINRKKKIKVSRFEKGDSNGLQKIINMSLSFPVDFKIYIVQPGLSKAEITESQKELLSVTENYLLETYQLPFGVIASS
jgi:superfamily II DNA or RNA helicase